MDKSKHRRDVATSEDGERGHSLTMLVKTVQSSQQKRFFRQDEATAEVRLCYEAGMV